MGRNSRPKISRESVLEAALALIDRDGITGFSMRKLGAELGIEAMTLYYHFPNKDAILDGLIEQITERSLIVSHEKAEEWTTWLRALAVSFRRELLRHPRLLPLVATRPAMTPETLRMVEQIVAPLRAAGFSPLRSFQILNTITTFVIGHTLAEAGDTPGHEDAEPDFAEFAKQLSSGDFPSFSAALQEGLGQPQEHQSRFDFALDALLMGLVLKTTEEVSR